MFARFLYYEVKLQRFIYRNLYVFMYINIYSISKGFFLFISKSPGDSVT